MRDNGDVRLFLSWSKPASLRMAEIFAEWMPQIIQEMDPWVSSEIDKGRRWAIEIGDALSDTGQGIICVTPENQKEPWLNFEAGSLAKSLSESRVRPVLLGLKPSELTGPLSHFQATSATDKTDMFKLMKSLNAVCAKPLDMGRLRLAFDRIWGDIETRLSDIKLDEESKASAQRSIEDVLDEVLRLVRGTERDRPGPKMREYVPNPPTDQPHYRPPMSFEDAIGTLAFSEDVPDLETLNWAAFRIQKLINNVSYRLQEGSLPTRAAGTVRQRRRNKSSPKFSSAKE